MNEAGKCASACPSSGLGIWVRLLTIGEVFARPYAMRTTRPPELYTLEWFQEVAMIAS